MSGALLSNQHSDDLAVAIFENVLEGIIVLAKDGTIRLANNAALELFGYTEDELLGQSIKILMGPEDADRHDEYLARHKIGDRPRVISRDRFVFGLRKNGTTFPIELTVTSGTTFGEEFFVGVVRDISMKERTAENIIVASQVFEHSNDAILVLDKSRRILRSNNAFHRVFGYFESEIIGLEPSILSSGLHPNEFFGTIWDLIRSTGHWRGEFINKRKDGRLVPVSVSISAIYDDQRAISGFIEIFTDKSDQRAAEEGMRRLKYHDELTGLANQAQFSAELGQMIAKHSESSKSLGVLRMDIDQFIATNSLLGYRGGNKLLIKIARRLVELLRVDDLAARYSGDEFAIALPGLQGVQSLKAIADKIQKALGEPFFVNEKEVRITLSVGGALFPDDASDFDDLLSQADLALRHAKHAGGGLTYIASFDRNGVYARRFNLEKDIRRALKEREFRLVYQPQYDAISGRIAGLEGLLRWQSQSGRAMSPIEFIPLAEQSLLIVDIGEYVFDLACSDIGKWREVELVVPRVAVNVSAKHFQRSDFIDSTMRILAKHGAKPQWFDLEVTEGSLLESGGDSIRVFQQLKELGFTLSIDDFGTGYSSLLYLKSLPVNKIKIDKGFIQDFDKDSAHATLCDAIINLSKSFGFKTVAEGVETVSQYEFLRELGCNIMQGYLFSKPLEAGEIEDCLKAEYLDLETILTKAAATNGRGIE